MPHFNPGVNVEDDGTNIGRFDILNFLPAGSAVVGVGRADITASGGSGGGGSSSGTLAARPAAAASSGMFYYATDVKLGYISDGATWTTVIWDHGTALTGLSDDDHPQYVLRTIATTKGDLLGRDGSAIVRVAVGTNDLPLVADSSASAGVSYKAIPEASVTNLVSDLAAKPTAALDTDGTLGANSDARVASQKATKTYADTKAAKASNLSDLASLPTARYNLHDQVLASAVAVSMTNLSLTGSATVDGVAVSTGQIVLAVGQTSASQNGPWMVNTAGAWTRPSDYPAAGTVIARIIEVATGNTRGGTIWVSTAIAAVTVDTTATTWVCVNRSYAGRSYSQAAFK